MALKRKITKTEYEALNDTLKAEYTSSGGGYVLDTDDAADLITARDNEKEARKAAEKKAKDLQAELDAATEKKNKENGDIEALEASWKKKFDDANKRADTAEAALADERKDRHVTGEAARIAKRFTVPGLVEGLIAKRLSVEIHDGKPIVRVLDKDGKPSAASVADLEKEFVDNPEYKSIVIASKASGSAEHAKRPGASGPPSQNFNNGDGGPVDLTKLPTKDLVGHMRGLIGDADE